MTFAEEMLERFGLSNGQFFGYYRYKNLQWFLDQQYIGFGDLKDEHILKISELLEDGERFVGMNEHHGTRWQQTDLPMIVIKPDEILFREDLVRINGNEDEN